MYLRGNCGRRLPHQKRMQRASAIEKSATNKVVSIIFTDRYKSAAVLFQCFINFIVLFQTDAEY